MSYLLNSYRYATEGPITAPVYGVAGAPTPLLTVDDINTAIGITTLSAADNNKAFLSDDAYESSSTVVEYGARLTHTDDTMYLHGYMVAVEPAAGNATLQYGLYKIPNGGAAVSNSNVPVLEASTVVSTTFEFVSGFGMPIARYIPLPAPIALPLGTYMLGRSGVSGDGSSVKVRSYGVGIYGTLPAGAGWLSNSAATALPSSWPAVTDTAANGPYWEHSVFAPNDTRPMVELLSFRTDRSSLSNTGTNNLGYIQTTITIDNDITGNKALIIPVSVVASAARTIQSITVDGIDGTQYIAPSGTDRAAVLGMWGASAGLTAGTHTVRVTFTATGGSDYLGTLNWFECDNVDQNFDNHFFSHILSGTTSSTSLARYSAPGTDRYYDAFFGSCMGGSKASPTYPKNDGIWGRNAEIGILAGAGNYPPGFVGLIPTLPDPWGLCYSMSGTAAHVFIYALLARA